MLKLSVSLLLSAMCALFLLGAVLDQLAIADNQPPPQQMQLYSRIMETISLEANKQSADSLAEFIRSQQQHWQLPFTLLQRNRLALPAELEQQLTATGGLPLESSEGISFLKALPAHPTWLLQLKLQPEPPHQPEDLWLTLALYSGLCLIMLLWLAPLMRRLWLLSHTAKLFGSGQFQARLPQSRWSYISQIEHSFNQMAQQMEQLLADNRLLASSLSHDLRTPIACFRFGLDAALEETDAEKKNSYLQRLEQDLDRMEAMVNAFLEYASLDRQFQHWRQSPVDMQALCQQAVHSCEPLAAARHVQIHLDYPSTQLELFYGHPHWLYRVLLNLLQNACRYARQQIRLTLWQQQQVLYIRVQDDGIGIDATDAERIFQPFVRLETQSSTAPQFGLGLAIVRKVLDWHQAGIQLETMSPQGASFVLTFPRIPADHPALHTSKQQDSNQSRFDCWTAAQKPIKKAG